jgi:hypothetical protein
MPARGLGSRSIQEFRLALPFLRTGQGDSESPLAESGAAESGAAAREYDNHMVSRHHGGAEGTSTRRPIFGQKAWSPTMIASDVASPESEPGWAASETGWPESEPEAAEPGPLRSAAYWPGDDAAGPEGPSVPDGQALRSPAYRQLWGPPRHRSAPRQALGQPYVWDGGRSDEYDWPWPARTSGPRHARQRPAIDPLTGPAPTTERAIIGDYLREIAAWCQIVACIARHTDVSALGEVDIRNKAVAAGWCVDLFGRLICPSCQQREPVWSARPLVVRDRAGRLLPMTAYQIGRHRRIRWPTPEGVDSGP